MSFLRRLYDVSKTSKKNFFFVTSLRRLEHISKKDVYTVTSLRRLKNICGFSKIPHENGFR